jgi:hypothetical protein
MTRVQNSKVLQSTDKDYYSTFVTPNVIGDMPTIVDFRNKNVT